MLLLWPGEVRNKRRDDFGRNGPTLFAANISDQSIKKISSTSYFFPLSLMWDTNFFLWPKVYLK